jgi:hypothetical protein
VRSDCNGVTGRRGGVRNRTRQRDRQGAHPTAPFLCSSIADRRQRDSLPHFKRRSMHVLRSAHGLCRARRGARGTRSPRGRSCRQVRRSADRAVSALHRAAYSGQRFNDARSSRHQRTAEAPRGPRQLVWPHCGQRSPKDRMAFNLGARKPECSRARRAAPILL